MLNEIEFTYYCNKLNAQELMFLSKVDWVAALCDFLFLVTVHK